MTKASKKNTEPVTEPAPLPPEVPAVPNAEPANTAGTPPTEPLLPLEQAAAKARDEKPYIVVAVFQTKSDSAQHHAAKVKAHLSQLGVEAQIVKTIQGDETNLLVDASAGLMNEAVDA